MSTDGGDTKLEAPGQGLSAFRWLTLLPAILFGAFCLSPSPVAQTKPVAAARSFFEPFDGLDGRRWYVSDGWVNGAHQGCTWSRAAVEIKKGFLQLSVLPRSNHLRPLICGEVQALGGTYGYGTYEARMRVAAGSGLNTAMFTYSGPPNTPIHDEIDFEFLGKSKQKVMLNYYVAANGENTSHPDLPADASIDFHNYAFVWEHNRVRWYVDGKLIRTADRLPLPSTAGKFYLSIWSGSPAADSWMGPLDQSAIPATASYDWVAYTAAGEKCHFPDSITCQTP